MKQLFAAAVIVFGAAFVTAGCASTESAGSNDIPKIDQDTKVYTTGSRIGRPDRAHETQPATK